MRGVLHPNGKRTGCAPLRSAISAPNAVGLRAHNWTARRGSGKGKHIRGWAIVTMTGTVIGDCLFEIWPSLPRAPIEGRNQYGYIPLAFSGLRNGLRAFYVWACRWGGLVPPGFRWRCICVYILIRPRLGCALKTNSACAPRTPMGNQYGYTTPALSGALGWRELLWVPVDYRCLWCMWTPEAGIFGN